MIDHPEVFEGLKHIRWDIPWKPPELENQLLFIESMKKAYEDLYSWKTPEYF